MPSEILEVLVAVCSTSALVYTIYEIVDAWKDHTSALRADGEAKIVAVGNLRRDAIRGMSLVSLAIAGFVGVLPYALFTTKYLVLRLAVVFTAILYALDSYLDRRERVSLRDTRIKYGRRATDATPDPALDA